MKLAVRSPDCSIRLGKEDAAKDRAESNMSSRKVRVLVVDDDPRVQRSIGRVLVGWGYAVKVVGDGLEALEKARSFKPRVIIADMRLPGMRGLELLKRFSEEVTGVYFIMIGGRSSSADFREGMQRGARTWLEKPFDPQKLRDELHKCLMCSAPE